MGARFDYGSSVIGALGQKYSLNKANASSKFGLSSFEEFNDSNEESLEEKGGHLYGASPVVGSLPNIDSTCNPSELSFDEVEVLP